MAETTIRILVVDDYEDWRNHVRQLLQTRPEWRVVCEVVDGAEAIEKAGELKPDLILLDIGLPKLNGIQAACRIRQVAPNSKILFLTIDNSLDIQQAALNSGAEGFVHKARSLSQLLPAIDKVLWGTGIINAGDG